MNTVETAAHCARGPSNSTDSTNIGSGGTTALHSTKCSAFAGSARRAHRLPIAQLSAANTVSSTGSTAAYSARCQAIAVIPATASTMPVT